MLLMVRLTDATRMYLSSVNEVYTFLPLTYNGEAGPHLMSPIGKIRGIPFCFYLPTVPMLTARQGLILFAIPAARFASTL